MLPPHKLITATELEHLTPQLFSFYQISKEDDEEYDNDDNVELLYFDQDLHLNTAQYDALKKEHGFYKPWAVNGNLVLENCAFGGSALVKGDLVCDSFGYGEWVLVQGKIIAWHYATFIAEDHEVLRSTAPLRLETPFVFSWFFDLKLIELQPNTSVFILCDGAQFKPMGLTDPYFFREEPAFVLKPEFCYKVDSYYSDALCCNLNAIENALQKGLPLFIEGFTTECMPFYRDAHRLMNQKKYQEAYLLFQKTVALSPGFYYPHFYMGFCLYRSSAYAQAIPILKQAVNLFPVKCSNLPNQAADYLALSALRLRKTDMAMEWSNFSIKSAQNNRDDGKKLWMAWRARGEAHLLCGDPQAAKDDLETAVNLNMESGAAHWLLGLAYHRLGNAKEADKHHQLATRLGDRFAADYNNHATTDFLQAAPTIVDWTELS